MFQPDTDEILQSQTRKRLEMFYKKSQLSFEMFCS